MDITIEGHAKPATAIQVRVANGAALLDKERPGWEEEVDLGLLNLGSTQNCVLGQIYGTGIWNGYDRGLKTLGLLGTPAAVDHGFSAGAHPAGGDYSDLTAAWRELISARRVWATCHEFAFCA